MFTFRVFAFGFSHAFCNVYDHSITKSSWWMLDFVLASDCAKTLFFYIFGNVIQIDDFSLSEISRPGRTVSMFKQEINKSNTRNLSGSTNLQDLLRIVFSCNDLWPTCNLHVFLSILFLSDNAKDRCTGKELCVLF